MGEFNDSIDAKLCVKVPTETVKACMEIIVYNSFGKLRISLNFPISSNLAIGIFIKYLQYFKNSGRT